MPLDASIYGQVGRGVRSVADYDAEALGLENARTQGEANRLALMLKRQEADQMAASAADQNALRQLYVELGNTPLDQMGTELRKRGRFNEGLKADQDAAKLANDRLTGQKTQADIGKIGAETTSKNVDTVGKVTAQFRDQLTMVRNPDDAVRWLKAQYDHPILGPEMERMAGPFMQAASRIPTTPQEFAQYIQSTGMGMEKFIQNQTAIRGQDTTAATAAANRERMAADAAASRAVQMRGQNLSDARARQANAIAAGELPSGAPVLGVPVPSVAPWANQSNARDANKVKAAEQTRGAKEVEKDIELATKEGAIAQAAKRFLELNDKVKTGTIADKTSVGRFVQSMGSDYAELEAITAKLVPGVREPGSGAVSDADMRMFERATIGVDKPKQANAAIAGGVIARAKNAEDYALFRQTYLEQNGTLQGADRYWKEYANANPIFDPTAKTPALNKNRKSWREHFAGSSGGNQPPASGNLSPAEAAELEQLRKQLGR